MNLAADKLRKGVRRVLMLQALLTLLIAAGFGVARGGPEIRTGRNVDLTLRRLHMSR